VTTIIRIIALHMFYIILFMLRNASEGTHIKNSCHFAGHLRFVPVQEFLF